MRGQKNQMKQKEERNTGKETKERILWFLSAFSSFFNWSQGPKLHDIKGDYLSIREPTL